MKQMQDFREWLSTPAAVTTPQQRRLAALTRLDRAQLSNASSELAWFLWEASQPVSAA